MVSTFFHVRTNKIPFADTFDSRDIANFISGPDGSRPPLDALPTDTPPAILDMIKYCWHFDREERLSAMQCFGIVNQCRDIFANRFFDIFLSHRWSEKYFVRHLYKLLVSSGYRVWYDENDMGHNLTESMKRGIERSKVVVACVSSAYQLANNTMFELKYARDYVDTQTGQRKPIVSVVLETNIQIWGNDELNLLCDIRTTGGTMYVDLSSVVTNYPTNESDARHFQVCLSFDHH